MGQKSFIIYGMGMSEIEAKRYALTVDLNENGHQHGYNGGINSAITCHSKCEIPPKPAKSCTVDKMVQKGARKWETVYLVEPKWGAGSWESIYVKTSQVDAIKKAKELALKNNIEYTVNIEKRLVDSGSKIATVSPKKSTLGKWKFWGDAYC